MSENLGVLRHTKLNVVRTDHEIPESNLHGYCVVNPQMLSQEEFQELHFATDPVLRDDGTYRNFDALTEYF